MSLSYDNLKAITELSEEKTLWWRSLISKERSKLIKKPSIYVESYLAGAKLDKNKLQNVSQLISDIRDKTWSEYISNELEFYKNIVRELAEKDLETRDILSSLVTKELVDKIRNIKTSEELLAQLSNLFGDFAGRIFPYFYELSKSVTQSRRSRAGKTFEAIIASIMNLYGYPYDTQSKIGKKLFTEKGLGKIVDGIVPSFESYGDKRDKCLVLTMKTTLRERWQEVVEELHRTNVPSIYLLTLDSDITKNTLNTMKSHNITLVTYLEVANKFKSYTNICSFEQLFTTEIPHCIKWWDGKK